MKPSILEHIRWHKEYRATVLPKPTVRPKKRVGHWTLQDGVNVGLQCDETPSFLARLLVRWLFGWRFMQSQKVSWGEATEMLAARDKDPYRKISFTEPQ